MKKSDIIIERLQSSMLLDRHSDIERILSILKSEITMVLKSYMEIETEDVNLEVECNDNGVFEFKMDAKTIDVFVPGKMID